MALEDLSESHQGLLPPSKPCDTNIGTKLTQRKHPGRIDNNGISQSTNESKGLF